MSVFPIPIEALLNPQPTQDTKDAGAVALKAIQQQFEQREAMAIKSQKVQIAVAALEIELRNEMNRDDELVDAARAVIRDYLKQ